MAGISQSGYNVNHLDLAPEYAGRFGIHCGFVVAVCDPNAAVAFSVVGGGIQGVVVTHYAFHVNHLKPVLEYGFNGKFPCYF